MADITDETDIPKKVYWDGKESMFFDEQGHTKGAKFFDKWKDRREEFPGTIEDIGGVRPARVPRSRRQTVQAEVSAEEVAVPPLAVHTVTRGVTGRTVPSGSYLDIATQRKAFFDAYVEVGFTREEALELCVK